MTDEAPAIKNKRQLLIGAILALVVVVVYNYHVHRVREAGKGTTVRLLRMVRAMSPGQALSPKDVKVVEVSTNLLGSLGGVVKLEPQESVADVVRGYELTQYVQEGWLLQTAHLGLGEPPSPSSALEKGMVAVSLSLDPRYTPGDILRVGDRVNILGMLQVGGQPLQAYRIIEGVKVQAVGGRGPRTGTLVVPSEFDENLGVRSYKSIVVQVPAVESTRLINVLSHVAGSIWVEIINPAEAPDSELKIRINPVLKTLSEAAVPTEG